MVCVFKQPFSVFKQHFTHFNALQQPFHAFQQPFNVELLQATEHGHNDLAIYIQSIKEENILNWVSR